MSEEKVTTVYKGPSLTMPAVDRRPGDTKDHGEVHPDLYRRVPPAGVHDWRNPNED